MGLDNQCSNVSHLVSRFAATLPEKLEQFEEGNDRAGKKGSPGLVNNKIKKEIFNMNILKRKDDNDPVARCARRDKFFEKEPYRSMLEDFDKVTNQEKALLLDQDCLGKRIDKVSARSHLVYPFLCFSHLR